MAKPDVNPRTCIVTREEKSPDEMIRFVLDGSQRVIPDLKRKLPGRGVWVSASKASVSEAQRKDLFSRGFKTKVKIEDDLSGFVEEMYLGAIIGLLSLARKAGMLVPGRANSEKALSSGASDLLIHATDAHGDGRRRLDQMVERLEVQPLVSELCEGAKLDQVSGVANTMHLVVINSGIADKIAAMIEKLEAYRTS